MGAGCFSFAAIAGALFLLVVAFVCGASHAVFPAQRAYIDQLRADAAAVQCGSAEDVVGQVTDVNARIASMREFNRMFDLFVPDGWERVDYIPVPQACP